MDIQDAQRAYAARHHNNVHIPLYNASDLRSSVAINPDTSVDVLARLSRDEHAGVRVSVAMNPNASVDVLARLSQDEHAGIRATVAMNPNTPTTILEELSKDSEAAVRRLVARNPFTPAKVLEVLSSDEDVYVRAYAYENPANPSVPKVYGEDEQALAAIDEDERVRMAVASNPDTDRSILIALHDDKSPLVRQALVDNVNAPFKALRMIAEYDPEKGLRELAMKRVAPKPFVAAPITSTQPKKSLWRRLTDWTK